MADTDLVRSLGRIEGKIDGILIEQNRIAEYAANTSERVGRLEQQVSNIRGWTAGISATIGAVAGLIMAWVKKKVGVG